MAAGAVLVADASFADGSYEGPKSRAEAHAGSKSGGIAVKGMVMSHQGQPQCCSEYQTLSPSQGGGFFFFGEASLAGQKNWSNAKASGVGPANAHSGAFGGSTAKTESTEDSSYGNDNQAGLSSESESPSGGGGSGTSASSFGGSSASASVGGGKK